MDLSDYMAELSRVAEETGVRLPGEPYRIALGSCYACGREMLIFGWPPGTMWSCDEPPPGRPTSVRWVETRAAGSYWGNACPRCGAAQGDCFVFGPDGPFAGRCVWEGDEPYSSDCEYPLFAGDYAADMETLARYHGRGLWELGR